MRAPFPWVVLAAYAIYWFAPRINQWLARPPRPPRPPVAHETPVQVRIIRRRELEPRRPGRELEPRNRP